MLEMTSRERIVEAINHRKPDVLPIDFGGMRSTGISVFAYNELKKFLKISGNTTKMYDVFQQLAEPEMEVINRLGGDVIQAHRLAPAFGIKINKWKLGKFLDGSDCILPEEYNPVLEMNGDLVIKDDDKIISKMPINGYYFDQVYRPYAHVESETDIDMIPIIGITDEELKFLEKEVKQLYFKTDKAILLSFGGNIFEAGQSNWGYEKFLTNLALNKELVHYWLDKLTAVYMEDLKKILSLTGKYINIIQFGDDLGTQETTQISASMYREMIMPYHARQFQYVRNNYPKVKVFLHSCGAIFNLIPDLINAGIEILNPVQISAKGMDPFKLKNEFGGYLTFWGGGANMQYTVNSGSIEQIKLEVKKLIEIFSLNGGYVFNQIHNIQANVSPEKIMAIYSTALEYREKEYKNS